MKILLTICGSILLLFSSCQKELVLNKSLTVAAQNVLQPRMKKIDFEKLDWLHAKSSRYNNVEILVIIPSKINQNEWLYFSHFQGIETFNWVIYQKNMNEYSYQTDKIILKDIDNKVINTFQIKNNNSSINSTSKHSYISNPLLKKAILDEDPIMEGSSGVVVSATIPGSNNAVEFYGLYWFMNLNPVYYNLYSLDPNSNNSQYGGSIVYLNQLDYSTHSTKGKVTQLANGQMQVTSSAPGFILAKINIKFNFDPVTLKFDNQSFSTTTSGIFAGDWVLDRIENIGYLGDTILFQFICINIIKSYVGVNFSSSYRMNINYNVTTNTVYWTWL